MILRTIFTLAFCAVAYGQDNPSWHYAPKSSPAEAASWLAASGHSGPGGTNPSAPPNEAPQIAAASLGIAQAAATAPTPVTTGNDADEITPAITALACGLHFDPVKIFEYVHNYIDFEAYYGSKKGAHLTLLEGSGNDFDQCALLMALLHASGYSANYKFGAGYFSYATLVSWVGLSPTPYSHFSDSQFAAYYGISAANVSTALRKRLAAYEFFKSRGFFYLSPTTVGSEEWFAIPHVWLEYSDNGTTRQLSPSLKQYTDFTGIDLVAATGYSRNQMLSDAAGTIGTSPDSITNLIYKSDVATDPSISKRLGILTQNLRSYLKANADSRDAAKITGTRTILRKTYASLANVDTITPQTVTWLTPATWSFIPDEQMSKIQITCGTGTFNASTGLFPTTLFNQTLKMPALKGRKLSLAFSGNTASIRLDETLLGSAFTISGASVDIRLNATHNHYELAPTTYAVVPASVGKSNQAEIKTYLKADTNAYALIYSFGNPDKLSRERQEVLDGYRRAGLTEADWRVKTEILNVMGLQWLYQTWQQEKVTAPLFNVLSAYHHRFGRVAQEQSYYIDVGLQSSSIDHRNQDARTEMVFNTFSSFVSSAMEHGVIEQMQGAEQSATSTVKMAFLANQQAIPIYVASAPNWSSVSTQLGTTYPAAIKTSIQTALTSNGGVALIPKSGLIAPNPAQSTPVQWKGYGYEIETPGGIEMLISGGYSGGYNAQVGTVTLGAVVNWMVTDPAYTSSPGTTISIPYAPHTTPPALSWDPVDMASGAFLLDKTDLVIGSGTSPRGLTFSRHYNSNRRFDKSSGIGYGWTHNYDISVSKRTSVKAGLAETISYQCAPFLAAMQAAADLYSNRVSGYFTADAAADTLTMPKHGLLAGDKIRVHSAQGHSLPAPLSSTSFYYVLAVDVDKIKLASTSGGAAINLTSVGTDALGAAGGTHFLDRDLSPKDWVTSALITHWAVDQLKYNAVAATMGNKTLEFVKMPDGTYEPPAGMNFTLASNGTGATQYFTITEQHGPTYTFNSAGKITEITDLWNKKQTFTYTDSQLTGVKDAYERTMTLTWTAGRITGISDSTGRSIVLAYTGDDLTGVTDVESKTWGYLYDSQHRMEKTKDPSLRLIIQNFYDTENRVCEQRTFGDAAHTWKLCYTGYCNMEERPLLTGATTPPERTCFLFDGRGRSIGTVNPLGERSDMFYDGQDRMFRTRTPKNEYTDYYFDTNHDVLEIWDAANYHGFTTYDAQHRVETIKDKRAKTTTVDSYNAYFQPTQVTAPLGRITKTTYTGEGEVDTVTDPENNVTDYDYDSMGRVRFIKLNGQTTQEYTYTDDRGDPNTSKDALGRVTSYTYNNRRQLRTTTLPAIPGQPAAIIEQTYDDEGNLASTIDPRLNTTSQTYTATGKPDKITAPAIPVLGGGSLNSVLTTSYDNRDWTSGSLNSLGHTTVIHYDAAQRVNETFDALNRKTSILYNANGQATQTTDPLLRVTKADYNAVGKKKKATDGLSKDTILGYDGNGNQTSLKNRRNKTYIFGYDDASRMKTTTSPTGKVITQEYWKNDLLKSVTEPSMQVVNFIYDARLRLQTKTDPVGVISYDYYANGNIHTVTEGTAPSGNPVITRTYDERNRLKTFTNADGDLLKYDYDATNNLTCITYPPDAVHPAGKQVNYAFNARNQLEKVTDWAARETFYRYDRLGRLLRIDRANGTSCVRDLDAAGQLLSQREIITATGRIFHYQKFSYDAAGQIQNKFTAPAGHPWVDPAFAGTYDDDNRLATANGVAVVHDADGNMTNGPITATSGIVGMTYNARNQLTSAGGISYTYDPEGRRRTMVQGTATTRYTIDPNGLSRLLVKHNPDGSKTFYVHGLGLLYEATKIGAAAEITITHHYDQVGSTVVRTDGIGHDVGRAEYSPYGQVTWQTGNMATPFLYNGKLGVLTDPNGLIHMRSRYYSPYLMRFLNPDPTGFSGGSNWFAFADGNPISANDPFGLRGNWVDYNGGWFHDKIWASTVNTIAGGYDALDSMGNAISHPVDTLNGLGKQLAWESNMISNDPLGYLEWGTTSLKNTAVSIATDPHAAGQFGTGILVGAGVGKVVGIGGEILSSTTSSTTSGSLAIRVIGKLDDTVNYVGRAGYEVIPGEGWSPLKNVQWVQEGIDAGAPFKIVSPRTPENMIYTGVPRPGPSVFGQETWQLLENGYSPIKKGSDIWSKVTKNPGK